jgi:hypothetical protein
MPLICLDAPLARAVHRTQGMMLEEGVANPMTTPDLGGLFESAKSGMAGANEGLRGAVANGGIGAPYMPFDGLSPGAGDTPLASAGGDGGGLMKELTAPPGGAGGGLTPALTGGGGGGGPGAAFSDSATGGSGGGGAGSGGGLFDGMY